MAPLTAALIYGIASLEYAAHRGKGGEGWGGGGADEEGKAVGEAHGEGGLLAWRFFRLEVFMWVGNWGLPLLLYQAALPSLPFSSPLFVPTPAAFALSIFIYSLSDVFWSLHLPFSSLPEAACCLLVLLFASIAMSANTTDSMLIIA